MRGSWMAVKMTEQFLRDKQTKKKTGIATAGSEDADEDAAMDESPRSSRDRYLQSSIEEVGDPDEWAELQYSGLDQFDHHRMVTFSNANRLRLRRALEVLQQRRQEVETAGSWEEASHCSRAIAEVRVLQDMGWEAAGNVVSNHCISLEECGISPADPFVRKWERPSWPSFSCPISIFLEPKSRNRCN